MLRNICRGLVIASIAAAGLTVSAANPAQVNKADTTSLNKLSYAFGVSMGHNLQSAGVTDVDYDDLVAGIASVLSGGPRLITEGEAREELRNFFMKLEEEKRSAAGRQAAENAAAGEKFLTENGKRPEVTTTASGLQYEVLQKGNGAKPGADDLVTVHYTGKLIDGTVFDSSVDRGKPATFGVNRVIAGWTEALQLMNEGSKWRLYIPASLAYGPNGAGDKIGPNTMLIFDVELLKVEK